MTDVSPTGRRLPRMTTTSPLKQPSDEEVAHGESESYEPTSLPLTKPERNESSLVIGPESNGKSSKCDQATGNAAARVSPELKLKSPVKDMGDLQSATPRLKSPTKLKPKKDFRKAEATAVSDSKTAKCEKMVTNLSVTPTAALKSDTVKNICTQSKKTYHISHLNHSGGISPVSACKQTPVSGIFSGEYLFSEDSKPNSVTHSSSLIFTRKKTQCQIMKALLVSQRKVFGSMLTRYLCTHKNEYG